MYDAGWNMPGYLPNTPPERFTTFSEAHAYIRDYLERSFDGFPNIETYLSKWEAQAMNVEGASIILPDGYVYWVYMIHPGE